MTGQGSPTRAWNDAERAALDRAPLIRVAGTRPDGSLRPLVQVGHVRVGGDELIRSLNGTEGVWYRGAIRLGHGQIDVAGQRIAVAFIPDSGREAEMDAALRARYGNDAGVRQMTSPTAREATLRIVPLA